MSDETQDETQRAEQAADELVVREAVETEVEEIDESKSAPEDRTTAGPFDVGEVPAMRPYVDLGGVKIAPREGLQMRLEVDERAKRVVAATLSYAESAVQVQAFSAPKTTGLWHRIRDEITQQMNGQGADVTQEDGVLGPELLVRTPAPADQGGTRVARFVGVDGPRWLLRGVIMGKAAVDAEARGKIVELFREVVVVRGDQPMPPGELLQLQVPKGVQQGGAENETPSIQPGGAQQA